MFRDIRTHPDNLLSGFISNFLIIVHLSFIIGRYDPDFSTADC